MIPDHAYATVQTMHRCGPCPFNWDDCHAPEGKTVWCRLLRDCATCPGPSDTQDRHFLNLRSASEEEALYPRWYEGYRTVEK